MIKVISSQIQILMKTESGLTLALTLCKSIFLLHFILGSYNIDAASVVNGQVNRQTGDVSFAYHPAPTFTNTARFMAGDLVDGMMSNGSPWTADRA